MADDENEYSVPLQHQRVFGAGIKRKRIQFVAQGTTEASTEEEKYLSSQKAVGDLYLSIVLPQSKAPEPRTGEENAEKDRETAPTRDGPRCQVCKMPIAKADTGVPFIKPHEASLAHQVCLAHSHPPSSLDRNHKGLQYLSQYGWDPDSRRGLGASGDGTRYPLKPMAKNDTLGLGLEVPKQYQKPASKPQPKLNAKQVRKRGEDTKRKANHLTELFYQSEEINCYLGNQI